MTTLDFGGETMSPPPHLSSDRVDRRRLSPWVRRADQRESVFAAAADVFAERGYTATTVDDLLAAAQIAAGNFYTLFDGKEDCFAMLLERILAEASERVREVISAEASWAERVYAGLDEFFVLVAEQPSKARIALVEARAAGGAAQRRLAQTERELASFVSKGRRAESTVRRPSFEDATVGGIWWVLYQRIASGGAIEAKELLGDFARALLVPYIGEEDTERVMAERNGVRE